jgi:signal transduction histidine kinase
VLVIDDEVRLAHAVASGVRAEGFDVDVARTGPDGLWRARRLVSDASHELRTPLAVMCTELEVAERDPGTDWSATSDVRLGTRQSPAAPRRPPAARSRRRDVAVPQIADPPFG